MIQASTRARGGVVRIPQELEASVGTHRQEEDEVGPVRILLRYDPVSGTLQDYFRGPGASGSMLGASAPFAKLDLTEHPFLVSQRSWSRPNSDVPLRALEGTLSSPWFGRYVSDSDGLALLHRQSGAAIVAEAFRHPSQRGLGPFGGGTVGVALASHPFGYVRVEGETVHVRPAEFWARRELEPPEFPLRLLERRPEPTIDEYAAYASGTVRKTVIYRPEGLTLLRVDPFLLHHGESALRVWGRLNERMRSDAMSGTPLPIGTMPKPAQEAALAAILEGVFAGGRPSDQLLERFDSPFHLQNAGDLALFIDNRGKRSFIFSLSGPGDPNGVEARSVDSGPLVGFVFGASVDEGVGFYIRRQGLPRPQ